MPIKPRKTAALFLLCLAVAAPARAAGPPEQELKSEIDDLLKRLETMSHGILKWEGADRMDIRRDGEAAVADIGQARFSVGPPDAKEGQKRVKVGFDHVEIRRAPAPGDAVKLGMVLPKEATVEATNGDEVKITLKDAAGEVLLDAKSGRARESKFAFAGARVTDKKSSDWVTFGPLSFASKVTAEGNGGWTSPVDFELKQIEFFFAQAPVAGAIDRIAYTARSAGPDLAALNQLRDKLEAMRAKDDTPPNERIEALLALLPSIPVMFSEAKGEFLVEGVVARVPTGEPYVTLAKATFGGALTGLSGETAALRITLTQDGLKLAPAITVAAKVPGRAVFDIGIEEVATAPLRSILEAAGKMGPSASDADKTKAQQQMLGAAAMLTPVLRVYDLAVDLPDVGVEASAEAKGSPLSPKGYSAQGDVAVRGFDALPGVVGDAPLIGYLPLLKEIGTTATAKDGKPQLNFHLASAPPKWITVNGGDVSAWFLGGDAAGQPRSLRPAQPAMNGADVTAVQRALAAAKMPVPQNGVYDGATAAAVAHFQKQSGLNVDGVVDAATRQKLGVKVEAPTPAGPKPNAPPPNQGPPGRH